MMLEFTISKQSNLLPHTCMTNASSLSFQKSLIPKANNQVTKVTMNSAKLYSIICFSFGDNIWNRSLLSIRLWWKYRTFIKSLVCYFWNLSSIIHLNLWSPSSITSSLEKMSQYRNNTHGMQLLFFHQSSNTIEYPLLVSPQQWFI